MKINYHYPTPKEGQITNCGSFGISYLNTLLILQHWICFQLGGPHHSCKGLGFLILVYFYSKLQKKKF